MGENDTKTFKSSSCKKNFFPVCMLFGTTCQDFMRCLHNSSTMLIPKFQENCYLLHFLNFRNYIYFWKCSIFFFINWVFFEELKTSLGACFYSGRQNQHEKVSWIIMQGLLFSWNGIEFKIQNRHKTQENTEKTKT